jgi:3-hydroxy acid dehydrogenase/malonic semialdehyde reductase
MMRTVFISGASSGIGEATARALAALGRYRLILAARRTERLLDLSSELSAKGTSCLCIGLDVRRRVEVNKTIADLPAEWRQIDVLINNAGLAAGLDPIQNGDADHWERMIDTNLKGLLWVTRAVVPGMVERNSGHIVNIGSIAGREVYANGNVYCATKHAVHALSRGMRMDLLPHRIKVTNIAPGLVETEFSLVRFDGDAERAKRVYSGISPLTANDIAECVVFAVSRPAHVNIDEMLVLCTDQGSATQVNRAG